MFELIKTENRARRGILRTVHGEAQTPVFMNVGTCAAIRGGISSEDLCEVKCQIELSNTYHLHVRPGEDVIQDMGGLRKFMSWSGPTLTDSGGFQVFSLAKLRRIKEEGVHFNSHMDGKPIFMGPEESMAIQSALGSTIAMAFDECVANPATYDYVKASHERTVRWLYRCRDAMATLNARSGAVNPHQKLFGINQGGTFADLRIANMEQISPLDLDGYAIGGLAVGEDAETMYRIIDIVEPYMPREKPRYLMGVGTPANILEAVERGIDMFDCVLPSRNGRHGNTFTWQGQKNINNQRYIRDERPIEEGCQCPTCRNYSVSYIRHLFKAREMLGMRLCVLHNLWFYNTLMEEIRLALDEGRFAQFKAYWTPIVGRRV